MDLKDAQLQDLGRQFRSGVRTVKDIQTILKTAAPDTTGESRKMIDYALQHAEYFLVTGHSLSDEDSKGD